MRCFYGLYDRVNKYAEERSYCITQLTLLVETCHVSDHVDGIQTMTTNLIISIFILLSTTSTSQSLINFCGLLPNLLK